MGFNSGFKGLKYKSQYLQILLASTYQTGACSGKMLILQNC